MNQPAPPDLKSGAVQDRPKGGGRRVRVVLGELKRRGRNTNLAVFAVLVAEADEDLLGAFGLAEVNSHLRYVFTKLGIRTRVELAGRAAARGISAERS
jgi:hypothetical protein